MHDRLFDRGLHRPWALAAAAFAAAALLLAAPRTRGDATEFLTRGMPYEAFDRLPADVLDVPEGILRVAFAPGDLTLSRSRVLQWISRSARAVALYYGRFPVASARVLIVPVPGRGVRGGQTFGYGGAAIRVLVGVDASPSDLDSDWIEVHEMVHLALPDVAANHLWLSEGLATYVEPIARAQAGDLTAQSIWSAFVRDIPKGLTV